MKSTDAPRVTVKLSTLEPGQGFRYVGLDMVRHDPISITGGKVQYACTARRGAIFVIVETETVELILEKKEFREIEGGQEFYDEGGLRYMKTDSDFDYYDKYHEEYVNAFCLDNRNMFHYDPYDPVFVVKK